MKTLVYPFTINGGSIEEPYGWRYRRSIKKAVKDLLVKLEKVFPADVMPALYHVSFSGSAISVVFSYGKFVEGLALDENPEDIEYETLRFYEFPMMPGGSMRGYASDYGYGENDREYTRGYLSDYFANGEAPFNDLFMKVFYHDFVEKYVPGVEEITFTKFLR